MNMGRFKSSHNWHWPSKQLTLKHTKEVTSGEWPVKFVTRDVFSPPSIPSRFHDMYQLSDDESELTMKSKPKEETLDVGPTKYEPKTILTKPWAQGSKWGSMIGSWDCKLEAASKLN